MSAATGTGLTSTIASDNNKGVFIYRSALAQESGTLSTTGVKLQWAIGTDNINPLVNKVVLKVFALEMVRIPAGAFSVGDGTATTVTGQFSTAGATTPFNIASENAITLGPGGLGNRSHSGMATADDFTDAAAPSAAPVNLPAAFPKGYQAFYIMKYDLTQGQYRDFLNTLTRTQQNQRAGNGTTLASGTTSVTNRYVMPNTNIAANIASGSNYRNGIRCDATIHATNPIIFYCDFNGNGIPNEPTDGEFIACNYLSWPDI